MIAVAIEYQRRLNRTSSTGLTKKVQNPGEIITAVIAAIVASGTWRAFSSCGTDITRMPPYMPNKALVKPIAQMGTLKRTAERGGSTVFGNEPMASIYRLLGTYEGGDRFDVLGEWQKIERCEGGETHFAVRGEARGVTEKGLEPAAYVHKALGRMLDEVLGESGVQALARRVRNHHMGAGRGQVRRTGRARDDADFRPVRRIELGKPELEPVQRMRIDFVHSDLARVREYRQTKGAHPGIEFGNPRALRNLRTHVLNDLLRDGEIVLPEGSRRIVDRGPAESRDHGSRPAPVLKVGTEDGIGALAVGVEPEAVKLRTQTIADQIEASRQGRGRPAVGDDHHLGALRTALHHDLQVAYQAQMRFIRVAGHSGLDEGAPHGSCNPVDQGMLNAAFGDVNHAVGPELKQPHLG